MRAYRVRTALGAANRSMSSLNSLVYDLNTYIFLANLTVSPLLYSKHENSKNNRTGSQRRNRKIESKRTNRGGNYLAGQRSTAGSREILVPLNYSSVSIGCLGGRKRCDECRRSVVHAERQFGRACVS